MQKPAAMVVDEAHFAKLLKSPVDVHSGQAERIGEHLLGERHLAAIAFEEPGSFRSRVDLAEHVGHAAARGQPGIARQPFAIERGLDQARTPDELLNARPFMHQPVEFGMRDHRDLTRDGGSQIAVEIVEVQGFERRSVARKIEGMDLPRAVPPADVPLQETGYNND